MGAEVRNICAIFQNHIKAASSGGVQSMEEEISDVFVFNQSSKAKRFDYLPQKYK